MTMRVVVTGSTGFVGRAVVARLSAARASVVGVARTAAGASPCSFLAVDLSRPDAADQLAALAELGPIDAVVHLAGLAHRRATVDEFAAHNVAATAALARWAAASRVGRVVLVSSVAVYGPSAEPADEQVAPAPITHYGRSKLAAEVAAADALAVAGVPLAVLRLATVYGSGDPGNVAKLARAVERRRLLRIGHGRNRKSLITIDDAATVVAEVALAALPITGTFNVATGWHELREIVAAMTTAADRRVSRRWLALPGQGLVVSGLVAAELAGGWRASMARRFRPLRIWLSDDAFRGEALAAVLGPRFPTPADLVSSMRVARVPSG